LDGKKGSRNLAGTMFTSSIYLKTQRRAWQRRRSSFRWSYRCRMVVLNRSPNVVERVIFSDRRFHPPDLSRRPSILLYILAGQTISTGAIASHFLQAILLSFSRLLTVRTRRRGPGRKSCCLPAAPRPCLCRSPWSPPQRPSCWHSFQLLGLLLTRTKECSPTSRPTLRVMQQLPNLQAIGYLLADSTSSVAEALVAATSPPTPAGRGPASGRTWVAT